MSGLYYIPFSEGELLAEFNRTLALAGIRAIHTSGRAHRIPTREKGRENRFFP